jgi:hypothetical protein
VDGGPRGAPLRAKISTMIMRPPGAPPRCINDKICWESLLFAVAAFESDCRDRRSHFLPHSAAPPADRAEISGLIGSARRFDAKKTPPAAHRMMDGLMDRKIPSQDRLSKGEALIAILLLSLCIGPVVWELASVVLRYL